LKFSVAFIQDYESLVAAKNKEKAALTKSIETKTVRVGELSVSIAEMSNDHEDDFPIVGTPYIHIYIYFFFSNHHRIWA